MQAQHSIRNYVVPAAGTVRPDDSLRRVQSLMQSGNVSTLVVARGKRPVGVIRKADVTRARGATNTSSAGDIMLADCPVLTLDTRPARACSELEASDLDRLPVVNSAGELIGVLPREALGEAMSRFHRDGDPPPHDQSTTQQIRRAFTVRPGMIVYSSDRKKLGLVDRMFLENGRVTGFLVTHGALGRRHKQLQFDVVDHLEDQTIILGIGESIFLQLPDVDPGKAWSSGSRRSAE